MTGRELMDWIKENEVEDKDLQVCVRGMKNLPVVWAWEGEDSKAHPLGTIMLETSAPDLVVREGLDMVQ